jgi:glycosyltransferase involved in cell wall biosynthesis
MSIPSAIFTIVSANYIAFAATLMQSVRRFHPDVPRFIILSDVLHSFGDLDVAADVIACDDLGIDLIGNMKLWYSVIEFNTAVKPFTFRHLFNERGFEQAVYLDPDIQLYSPLEEVFRGLEHHSLVLTPHMMKPLQDGKHPSDLSIMKSGVYNLGFAAIKNDPDGRGLIDWWCDRLFAHCRVDVPGNIFTDQRWMDLSPVFVERPFILRHPGYNVAYWNLVHRTVEQGADGTWRSNGVPLAFFHFSGVQPEDPTVFSKHQDRFTIETLGPVAQLCDEYRAKVLANGWLAYKKVPYGFGNFADGRKILDAMRRWVLDAIDDGRLPKDKPLRLGSVFFDAADEVTFAGNRQLTRFAHQFWRDRPDLQGAFNLNDPSGFDGYVAWFCDGPADREGIAADLIQAARLLRDGPSRASLPTEPVQPPWPALATDAWTGPAREAAQWLTGELHFEINGETVWLQRQAALLWERRLDLQQFFPLRDGPGHESYHLWTLTDGMREGSIDADLFTPSYIAWLEAPSSISKLYSDVPITRGMALTRRSEHGRAGLQTSSKFPLEARARLEQAFWYAFIAPQIFHWPAAMTATVRSYFDAPSGLRVSRYSLSNGAVSLHQIRADIQQSFDLQKDDDRWSYLCWLLTRGAAEYQIDILALCPGLAAFLASPSERYPLMSHMAEMAYHERADLKAAFNLNTRADLAGMLNWVASELPAWVESVGLQTVIAPPAKLAAGVHRCFVVLTGDWVASSGIGEDLRTAVAALDAVGFSDYVIVDLPSRCAITADRAVLPAGTLLRAAWNLVFHNADTALDDWRTIRMLPIEADRVAAHWLWELERLPARWIHAFSFCDEIWASSEFVRSIFDAEDRRPVRLIHHAVTAPRPSHTVTRRELDLPENTTVFLFMFDFASYAQRKNPIAVVRAFLQAFPGGDEPACLVIKTQNAGLRPELWAELYQLTDDPRVMLRDARLSRDELTGLIAASDAFVSLHRSEGFGRGPAEAMLLGIPVIVTGYSGTLDFTDGSCACVVGYTLVPVMPGEYPGVEGQRWAEADVAQAARYMRWIQEEPEAARAMGLRGQQRATAMLAPAKIGADMLGLLGVRTERTTQPMLVA